jgi:hypothetical protein
MTFRDDRQRGAVCHALCSWMPANPWELTETGYRPKRTALQCVKLGLSSGELAMVSFAQALWRGDDPVIFLGWDRDRMRQALTALLAMHDGPDAVDAWLRDRATRKVAQQREKVR